MSIISVEENIGIPKYKQIVLSVEKAVSTGHLKKGDALPSINAIKNKFSLFYKDIFSQTRQNLY